MLDAISAACAALQNLLGFGLMSWADNSITLRHMYFCNPTPMKKVDPSLNLRPEALTPKPPPPPLRMSPSRWGVGFRGFK